MLDAFSIPTLSKSPFSKPINDSNEILSHAGLVYAYYNISKYTAAIYSSRWFLIKRQMWKKREKITFTLLFCRLFLCLEKFFHHIFVFSQLVFFVRNHASLCEQTKSRLFVNTTQHKKKKVNIKLLTKVIKFIGKCIRSACTLPLSYQHTLYSYINKHTFDFTSVLDLFNSMKNSVRNWQQSNWNEINQTFTKSYCLMTWHYYHAFVIVLLAPSC